MAKTPEAAARALAEFTIRSSSLYDPNSEGYGYSEQDVSNYVESRWPYYAELIEQRIVDEDGRLRVLRPLTLAELGEVLISPSKQRKVERRRLPNDFLPGDVAFSRVNNDVLWWKCTSFQDDMALFERTSWVGAFTEET